MKIRLENLLSFILREYTARSVCRDVIIEGDWIEGGYLTQPLQKEPPTYRTYRTIATSELFGGGCSGWLIEVLYVSARSTENDSVTIKMS